METEGIKEHLKRLLEAAALLEHHGFTVIGTVANGTAPSVNTIHTNEVRPIIHRGRRRNSRAWGDLTEAFKTHPGTISSRSLFKATNQAIRIHHRTVSMAVVHRFINHLCKTKRIEPIGTIRAGMTVYARVSRDEDAPRPAVSQRTNRGAGFKSACMKVIRGFAPGTTFSAKLIANRIQPTFSGVERATLELNARTTANRLVSLGHLVADRTNKRQTLYKLEHRLPEGL